MKASLDVGDWMTSEEDVEESKEREVKKRKRQEGEERKGKR